VGTVVAVAAATIAAATIVAATVVVAATLAAMTILVVAGFADPLHSRNVPESGVVAEVAQISVGSGTVEAAVASVDIVGPHHQQPVQKSFDPSEHSATAAR